MEDKLKFLENQRYKTTSAREDEQILNEMEALEKAKNGFASFQAQQEALNQDRQLQKGLQAKLDALKTQMNPLTTKEKEHKKIIADINNAKSQEIASYQKEMNQKVKEHQAAMKLANITQIGRAHV